MGKFDLDDLLDDLGEPDPDAPAEGPTGVDAAAEALRPRSESSAPIGADAPRPPDLTGTGLGSALPSDLASRTAPRSRVRPEDALQEILVPDAAVTFGSPRALVGLLEERGLVTPEQIATYERVSRQTPGRRPSEVLVEIGADEERIQRTVAELHRLPFERVASGDEGIDVRSFNRLGSDFCGTHHAMPLRREGLRLVVGTAAPDDVFLLDDIKRRLGVLAIRHVLITAADVRAVIEAHTEADAEEYDVDEILADVDEDDVEVVQQKDEEADETDAESSPVVRYVNHIIQTALKEGASDIHIEPDEKTLKVRFRIDGVLFEMMNPPRKMHAALTSRIKIMANLDIAERRLPQDGRIRATVLGRKLDLRVSTVPTPKGEKTVMRILDNRAIKVSLDELGFGPDTLTIWKNQIRQPHGIILVTGPTGSGKTTTLYASLQQLDLRKLNVSTVEDPVEYNLSGITQIQTHERIGMTFSAALKALLRQDPDVVMVGEIRDIETATTATQAAMTGHLVLSTLHTNDAPSSLTRLINIGIEPFLVAAACNGVLAQRLVRRICKSCRQEHEVTDDIRTILEMHGVNADTITRGKGCGRCRETGYSGRQGLYELLILDDFLRDKIARSPNVTEFRRTCAERGMVTLREDGFQKVADGITTVEEILRVTESTI